MTEQLSIVPDRKPAKPFPITTGEYYTEKLTGLTFQLKSFDCHYIKDKGIITLARPHTTWRGSPRMFRQCFDQS